MPDKLLELKNDLVFQKLFGNQKNKLITTHFLSLILEKEIFNLDLDVNKRMLRSRENSKTGRLDIRAKFNNGEDCNIELQVMPYPYMVERMLEYWSGMYDNKISSGQGYEVLKPLLEIPKIKENEILKDELARWLKFIENPENKEVEKFMRENKFWKQAKEELAYLSGDPDFQRLVESRAGFLMDEYYFRLEAKREGREEGREEIKREMAKKLLKFKMPIEQIIEITELSREEIERLN